MEPQTVHERRDQVQVVDVREEDEWAAGRIEGARHIPLGQPPASVSSTVPWPPCAAAVAAPAKPLGCSPKPGSPRTPRTAGCSPERVPVYRYHPRRPSRTRRLSTDNPFFGDDYPTG
jgi:hypothetical protein